MGIGIRKKNEPLCSGAHPIHPAWFTNCGLCVAKVLTVPKSSASAARQILVEPNQGPLPQSLFNIVDRCF
jgi:hypothetical protein